MYGTFIQCQHAAVVQEGQQSLPIDQGVQNKFEA